MQVPVPSGYRSAASYFGEVAEVLETLHHTQAHPIDQSVRGGTQTNGFLFRIAEPLVKSLEQQIRLPLPMRSVAFPMIHDILSGAEMCREHLPVMFFFPALGPCD